ncbi:PREDICTED: putative rRNA 2'-O-methyltransferase fibrillarin 3 [Camelina sativa]|uniref:rRNA 2'-O-methyltransferase fibrillarin 3 n=1 Tax=Camelina sativa TaxID=90675 RepID=A0ABM0UTF0_CAMSA|nr:PREDICTED: putative rRNA 2'-O-methyltransferase fibrillarin 3 [Camelina sativa]
MTHPQRRRGGGGRERGLATGGGGSAVRGRGSESGGGIKGGSKVLVAPHRHAGVSIAKSKGDALVTKNLVPGEIIYNEKRIFVQNEDRSTVEYRIWNPHRSKLAAAINIGVDNIWIKPGLKVLYLGASANSIDSNLSAETESIRRKWRSCKWKS